MRVVLQRVSRAAVTVDGENVASIGPGLLLLVGVEEGDDEAEARRLAEKCAAMRIFASPNPTVAQGPSPGADPDPNVAQSPSPGADPNPNVAQGPSPGAGKFDLSLLDTGGEALVVSQFTLLADVRKGRRPSFTRASRPEAAEPLVEEFAEALRSLGVPTRAGRFGARMVVDLVNDGPVTIVVDSADLDRPRRGG